MPSERIDGRGRRAQSPTQRSPKDLAAALASLAAETEEPPPRQRSRPSAGVVAPPESREPEPAVTARPPTETKPAPETVRQPPEPEPEQPGLVTGSPLGDARFTREDPPTFDPDPVRVAGIASGMDAGAPMPPRVQSRAAGRVGQARRSGLSRRRRSAPGNYTRARIIWSIALVLVLLLVLAVALGGGGKGHHASAHPALAPPQTTPFPAPPKPKPATRRITHHPVTHHRTAKRRTRRPAARAGRHHRVARRAKRHSRK